MDFERLAARHKDEIYRQLLRMCGNREDAEDVLVESLLKAYRAKDQLDNEGTFQAWLAIIGRRTCGRLKRKQQAHPEFSLDELVSEGFQLPADAESPETIAMEHETKDCLMRAFEKLPPEFREVYQSKDLEGKSLEEIATDSGLSLAATKSRLHRARKLLRELIDGQLSAMGKN